MVQFLFALALWFAWPSASGEPKGTAATLKLETEQMRTPLSQMINYNRMNTSSLSCLREAKLLA
jgi:hypothetical protein